MTKHARLSPSSADRWIHCPGSVRLSEQCPLKQDTVYTTQGTSAHEMAELKLLDAFGSAQGAALEAFRKGNPDYDGEMEEATDFYRDLVFEKMMAAGRDAELLTEQKLSLEPWVENGYGFADAVIIANGLIEIIDFKYGQGVSVGAKGNPQMRLYGLGALSMFSMIYDLNTVRMTIVQPRLDRIDTEEITAEELQQWAEDVIVPAAKKTQEPDAETAAGDWCRWCPARALCRTHADAAMAACRYDFRLPDLLTDEELGEAIATADRLQAWLGSAKDYAFERALAGDKIPGWKLVEGRSVRKYADDLKVAETLIGAGYDEPLLYERKLNGITAMEKLVGKKKLAEILGDLIVKPAGKPTLVPESDKRKDYNSAEADFAEEI